MTQFKSFLKGKGFYITLFVCICIIATTAVVVTRTNVNDTEQSSNVEENQELAQNEESSVIEFDNAELVENERTDENTSEDEIAIEDKSTDEDKETVSTSTTPGTMFINPLDNGVISRTYNILPRLNEEKNAASVFKGIDIEGQVGAAVKAIANGKVLEATKGDSKEGYYITLEHTNGFISTYANLDEKLNVKVGDEVKQGDVLGNIGVSISTNPQDRISDGYLLLHMENNSEPVNPQEYIKDIKVK